MTRIIVSAIAASAGLAVGVAGAQTTVFGPNSSVGGQPDASVLNGLGAFTQFGGANGVTEVFASTPNVGENLFFQLPAFYVGGAGPAAQPLSSVGLANLGGPISNNRAYGVIGRGRSDITFTPGSVSDILLQIRGTDGTETTGGNPANSFGGAVNLDAANGTVLVYTELGFQTALSVSNSGFNTLSVTAATLAGDFITRISIINDVDNTIAGNSAVVLGELTVVPAPASAALLGLGGLAAVRRRR